VIVNRPAWVFAVHWSADWGLINRGDCLAVKRKFGKGRPSKRNGHGTNKTEVGDKDLGDPSAGERGIMDFAQHCRGTSSRAASTGTNEASIRTPAMAPVAAPGTDEANV